MHCKSTKFLVGFQISFLNYIWCFIAWTSDIYCLILVKIKPFGKKYNSSGKLDTLSCLDIHMKCIFHLWFTKQAYLIYVHSFLNSTIPEIFKKVYIWRRISSFILGPEVLYSQTWWLGTIVMCTNIFCEMALDSSCFVISSTYVTFE